MKLLAISDLREAFDYIDRLPEVVQEARIDAVLFAGEILQAEARKAEWERAVREQRLPDRARPEVVEERKNDAESLMTFFRRLNTIGVPVYVIPGRNDAPERFFMQAAFNSEIVTPHVHMVHRSFAPLGGRYMVAGFGGEVTVEARDHEFFLRYPGWEAIFSLDFLRHLDPPKILLCYTAPADRFEEPADQSGPAAVAHLIKTYDPHFVVCAGVGGRKEKKQLGNTLVVFPGSLAEGDYAIIDTREKEVAFGNLR
ncbi:metallophosphoesterase [Rhodothermus marinus]|uniref:metallophosphoesterase n=1 Tax=Rhodothermus marinus TaxID=29549 RepID=UPI0006D1C827|nr:metallophosphoesterase [Rhodothermus marinus]